MISFPLTGRATFFYVWAALSFVGTVAVTTLLFTTTERVCDAQGYCHRIDVDNGIAAMIVLVSGLLQTVVMLTIGQLCGTLGNVVAAVNREAVS